MILEKDVLIYDIETIKGCFCLCSYDLEDNKKYSFEVNEYKNELGDLIKYLIDNKYKYWVGWNNLNFDNQVIQYIYDNFNMLMGLSNLEFSKQIWQISQDIIETSNYGGFQEYKEEELDFKPIDLFKILHFDNINRRSNGSLKNMEYFLGLSIETFDFDHKQIKFTPEECFDIVKYCHYDVYATLQMYYLIRGQVDNMDSKIPNWIKSIYKDNDQIRIRTDIKEQFEINALNYSDSKMGDEITKYFYCKHNNVSYKELPRSGTFRKKIELHRCVPNYIKFKSEKLNKILDTIKGTVVGIDEKFKMEDTFKIGNTYYQLASGGIHSENEFQSMEPEEGYSLIDIDVSGYYPNIIVNNDISPKHLGDKFIQAFKYVVNTRLELKKKESLTRKEKGLGAALKLGGNSVYGKLNDKTSWLYDYQAMLSVTLTGQLSLLMLIEELEASDISVIMANTDGILVKLPTDKRSIFDIICSNWEEKTKYILEENIYSHTYFQSVNNYISLYEDGSIKTKGDTFMIDIELHKDKSSRITRLALTEYFINGTKVEDFIKNHTELDDFCIRGKVSRDFYIEYKQKNKVTKYNKLIRYYISKKGGELIKVKRDTCLTNAAPRSYMNVDTIATIANDITKIDPNNINREWYINKCNEIIISFNLGRKIKKKKQVKEQLKLF